MCRHWVSLTVPETLTSLKSHIHQCYLLFSVLEVVVLSSLTQSYVLLTLGGPSAILSHTQIYPSNTFSISITVTCGGWELKFSEAMVMSSKFRNHTLSYRARNSSRRTLMYHATEASTGCIGCLLARYITCGPRTSTVADGCCRRKSWRAQQAARTTSRKTSRG